MRILLLCLLALVPCTSAGAATEAFPNDMRGFWADKKATCDILKSSGPASLSQNQYWLKITATDVLGSTQGRFFRELPIDSISVPSTRLSIAIQAFGQDEFMHELALIRDGRLIERVVGARAVATYLKC
jgi:hypothetical protein